MLDLQIPVTDRRAPLPPRPDVLPLKIRTEPLHVGAVNHRRRSGLGLGERGTLIKADSRIRPRSSGPGRASRWSVETSAASSLSRSNGTRHSLSSGSTDGRRGRSALSAGISRSKFPAASNVPPLGSSNRTRRPAWSRTSASTGMPTIQANWSRACAPERHIGAVSLPSKVE
jgi:hypothetical protein